MSSTPPPSGSAPSGPPQGASRPPGSPVHGGAAIPRDGRPVSFYVAIFLALLLLVSGGLNLVLLVVSAFGSATGAGGISGTVHEDDGVMYELVAVDGDRRAEHTVLRIPIDGAIAEAGSPLIGAAGGTVSQVRRALRAAERADEIAGVLFDINSPGGGVTDSDEIWRLIRRFKNEHPKTPVVAIMGDVAASGGYYIAAACDAILARPTTITGSIGVIISSYNFGELMEHHGVKSVTIVSPDTPYKDMLSPTRPMLPEEKVKITAIVQEMYERFVDIVDEGRPKLDRAAVKAAATGEIYSASRALELGLVDEVGTIADAHDKLRSLMDVDSFRVVEHRRVPTLFDALFRAQQRAPSLDGALASLLRSSTGPRLMYYWPGAR